MKIRDIFEFGYMEVCTTQWTFQWTILQNNTGQKATHKPPKAPSDTKSSFIFPQRVILLQDLVAMPPNYLVVSFIAWESIFRTEEMALILSSTAEFVKKSGCIFLIA